MRVTCWDTFVSYDLLLLPCIVENKTSKSKKSPFCYFLYRKWSDIYVILQL